MMDMEKRKRRRKIRIAAEKGRRRRRGNTGKVRKKRGRFLEIGENGMRRQAVTEVADTSDSPCVA